MIKIGDTVQFKKPYAPFGMVVLAKRKMFASDIHAYTVKYPNGEIAEYDETQLVKLDEGCGNCDDMVLYLDEQCPNCGRQA
tara:strand:- start:548 stop:790 length:243 start_codon:yes stop_codon:yes gene_type:complete